MREKIPHLFLTTDLTYLEIAKETNTSYKIVTNVLYSLFSKEDLKKRKHNTYAKSKLGSNNPMYGKRAEQHHGYKGIIDDGKGYSLILKPEWYTGRKGTKHIFYHHFVICDALHLTEIPKGWHVHHLNGDPKDNRLENLSLITRRAHCKLHNDFKKRATTKCTPKANVGGNATQAVGNA